MSDIKPISLMGRGENLYMDSFRQYYLHMKKRNLIIATVIAVFCIIALASCKPYEPEGPDQFKGAYSVVLSDKSITMPVYVLDGFGGFVQIDEFQDDPLDPSSYTRVMAKGTYSSEYSLVTFDYTLLASEARYDQFIFIAEDGEGEYKIATSSTNTAPDPAEWQGGYQKTEEGGTVKYALTNGTESSITYVFSEGQLKKSIHMFVNDYTFKSYNMDEQYGFAVTAAPGGDASYRIDSVQSWTKREQFSHTYHNDLFYLFRFQKLD